jgi:hypothetical protein
VQDKDARQVLASDPRRTKLLTQYLIRKLDDYVSTHHDIRPVDVFMALHNLHKIGVMHEAERMELTGRDREVFFRTAMDTFAQGLMREHAHLLEQEDE